MEVLRPDGSFWNVQTFPVLGEAGMVEGVVLVARDVTRHRQAEQALAESEEKYHLLFKGAPIGICIYDRNGRILEVNQACAQIMGTTVDRLLGFDLIKQPKDVDFVKAIAHSLDGRETRYEGFYISVTGRRKSCLKVDFAPLYSAAGDLIGGVAVGEDIIEQVRADRALRRSEEKYRRLFEGIPIGLFQVSKAGLVVDANAACAAIMRCREKGDLIGLDVRKFYVSLRDGHDLGRRFIAGGSVQNYETRLWRFDRSVAWVNISARAIYDPDGGIEWIEGSLEDITERKAGERRIEESEARFRGLAERSSDIIALFDKSCQPVFWSPSAERILGYSRRELMEMRSEELFPPSQYARMQNYIGDVLKNQVPDNFEVSMIQKGGAQAVVELTASAIHDGTQVSGIQFIGRDVTIRKEAEDALKKSHLELRRLSGHLEAAREQERMSIAREVHDDLGQAMTAIKFDLAWLKRKMREEESAEFREKIDASIGRVNGAIQAIKQIASHLRPEILNDLGLAAAMEWYLEDFRRRTGIDYEARIDGSALDEPDLGDKRSISIFRILQEALANVARHAAATEVFVSLHTAKDEVEFLVNDNGKGIDPKQINTNVSFGLIGIRERANSMGGEMTIFGRYGEGTTLRVRLPMNGKEEKQSQNSGGVSNSDRGRIV
jgi:PAS domain S-box-containing protein